MLGLSEIYQKTLLKHAHLDDYRLVNKKQNEFDNDQTKAYKISNPKCGDKVIIYLKSLSFDLKYHFESISDLNQESPQINVCFDGDGCALMNASASIMSCVLDNTKYLSQVISYFGYNNPFFINSLDSNDKIADLLKNKFKPVFELKDSIKNDLDILRHLIVESARKECILLPWQALIKCIHK